MSKKNLKETKPSKEKKQLSTIHLIQGYVVSMERRLNYGLTPYLHYAEFPKEMLQGVDYVPCCIRFPFSEPVMIGIDLGKEEYDDCLRVNVDSLVMGLSRYYKHLDEDGLLGNHVFSDLWIEGLDYIEGILFVHVMDLSEEPV